MLWILLKCEDPVETFPFNVGKRGAQQCTKLTVNKVKSQKNNYENHKSPKEDDIQAELH